MPQAQNNGPVYELMQVRNSLQLLAGLLDNDVDRGQANIIGQLAKQVDAVQQLDDEDWQPTRPCS